MKKMTLAVIASLILTGSAFAQSSSTSAPKPPAAWVTFQQQQDAKRMAFFKEMSAERTAFLQANPDVKEYFDQMAQISKERMAAWRAAHPRKITN
jgi:hypothetical protein